MKRLLLPLLVLLPSFRAGGAEMNAGELAHALDRLSSTARVLYVAAHPDDENTRLLAWLANGRHVRAAYLSMTRGGGGQNLIGDEQGELLDAIRTEELLAARSVDGALQFFTRMRDFGYSKSAAETLSIWGHDEALKDVVRVVRAFRPDVIVTRFSESPPNHGHHTASAILAREAMEAAADPSRFVGVGDPWKVKRLVHNFGTWRGDVPPKDALSVDVGGYDARLGLGYGELAALSRTQHKSQGFGSAGQRGELLEYFVHVEGDRAKADLLDGVPMGWERFGAKGKAFGEALRDAARQLDRDAPEKAIPSLVQARRRLDELGDDVRVREARVDLDRILVAAAGIFFRAVAERPFVTPGEKLPVEVELLARRASDVRLHELRFSDGSSIGGGPLGRSRSKFEYALRVPEDQPISMPYWLARTPSRGRYELDDESLVGRPRGIPPLRVRAELEIGGERLALEAPLLHSRVDRVHGERLTEVAVLPPATLTPQRKAVISVNGEAAAVVLRMRAGRDGVEGEVGLELPPGLIAEPALRKVRLEKAGDEATLRFDVKGTPASAVAEIRPFFRIGEERHSYREDRIDHPHIPPLTLLQPASFRLSAAELQVPGGLVGYIPGSGDTVAEDLAHVGVRVERIDEATLLGGDLSRYSAIVAGVRAYNSRPVMRAAHARLLAWVERGGTLVVQYNTSNRWNPLDQPIGPFPFEVGDGRVTDERARMIPVDPSHPLLRRPHAISDADFEGWVQERGIYFAKAWDERYQPLFRTADPDEDEQKGATLVARHGEGRYVYTGLAFFRQLRAGVPGAYRLFLNFVSGN